MSIRWCRRRTKNPRILFRDSFPVILAGLKSFFCDVSVQCGWSRNTRTYVRYGGYRTNTYTYFYVLSTVRCWMCYRKYVDYIEFVRSPQYSFKFYGMPHSDMSSWTREWVEFSRIWRRHLIISRSFSFSRPTNGRDIWVHFFFIGRNSNERLYNSR